MKSIWCLLAVAVAGCSMGRAKVQDAWVGQPVEVLNTHSPFRSLPMIKVLTEGSGELRNYQNRANTHQCYTEGQVTAGQAVSQATYNQILACTSRSAGCDHIFSVRGGKILDYTTGGRLLDACPRQAPP